MFASTYLSLHICPSVHFSIYPLSVHVSLHMFVCVFVHIYIYIYICIYMCVYVYVCVCLYVCVCIYVYVCVCICMYVCVYVYIIVCVYMIYIDIYVCVCIYKEVVCFSIYVLTYNSEKRCHWALNLHIHFNILVIGKSTKFCFWFYWLNDIIQYLKIDQFVKFFTDLQK